MNYTQAQIDHTRQTTDGFIIPPLLVCSRYEHLAVTVLYDLLAFEVPWQELEPLVEKMCLRHTLRNPDAILSYVAKRGRVIIDQWHGPVTHHSHAEPV